VTAPEPTPVALARFVFVLPEPLPMPDGTQVQDHVGDLPDAPTSDDDPWVALTFHQVSSPYGRTKGGMDAVAKVLASEPGLVERDPEAPGRADTDGLPDLEIAYTVVDATTTDVDVGGDQEPFDVAQEVPPTADPFNRCLRLVQDLARAYRVTVQGLTGLPTYERLPHPVLAFRAVGELVEVEQDGLTGIMVGVPESGWGGPQLMMLDHMNAPDPILGPLVEGDTADQFDYWVAQIREGNPLMLALEGFLGARRALQVEGDYPGAVVLAETASEVAVDGVLAMLLWESGVEPEGAAGRFEEGKVTRRVRTDLPALLGGDWRLEGPGAAAVWFRDAVRLRHRVVHGGYRPTRTEAAAAVRAVLGFERHIYDRLAARRNEYPRSTLMTVAEQGLRKRDLWGGQIRRFAEEVAPTEPPWRESYRTWRDRMVTRLLDRP